MKSKMLGALALFTLIGALFVMQSADQYSPTADAAAGSIAALNVGTCLTTDADLFKGEDCDLSGGTGSDSWEIRDEVAEVTTLYATYAHDPKTSSTRAPRAILEDSDLIKISIADSGRDKRTGVLIGNDATSNTLVASDSPYAPTTLGAAIKKDLDDGKLNYPTATNAVIAYTHAEFDYDTNNTTDYVIANSGTHTLNFTRDSGSSEKFLPGDFDVENGAEVRFYGCVSTDTGGTANTCADDGDPVTDPIKNLKSELTVDEDRSNGEASDNIAPWLVVNASVPNDMQVVILAIYYRTSDKEDLVGGQTYRYCDGADVKPKENNDAWSCSSGTLTERDTKKDVNFTSEEQGSNNTALIVRASSGGAHSVNLFLTEKERFGGRYVGYLRLTDEDGIGEANSDTAPKSWGRKVGDGMAVRDEETGDLTAASAAVLKASGPVTITYRDSDGTQQPLIILVDTEAPTIDVSAPANGSSSDDQSPDFSGNIQDSGSGLVEDSFRLVIDNEVDDNNTGANKDYVLTTFASKLKASKIAAPATKITHYGEYSGFTATDFAPLGIVQASDIYDLGDDACGDRDKCHILSDEYDDGASVGTFDEDISLNLRYSGKDAVIRDKEYKIDFQAFVMDLAGNIGFSDSDAANPSFINDYGKLAADREAGIADQVLGYYQAHIITLDEKDPEIQNKLTQTGYYGLNSSDKAIVDRSGLMVVFDGPVDPASVSTNTFTVELDDKSMASVVDVDVEKNYVFLKLASELASDARPTIDIASGEKVEDMAGNETFGREVDAFKVHDGISPKLTITLSGGSGSGTGDEGPGKLTKDRITIHVSADEKLLGGARLAVVCSTLLYNTHATDASFVLGAKGVVDHNIDDFVKGLSGQFSQKPKVDAAAGTTKKSAASGSDSYKYTCGKANNFDGAFTPSDVGALSGQHTWSQTSNDEDGKFTVVAFASDQSTLNDSTLKNWGASTAEFTLDRVLPDPTKVTNGVQPKDGGVSKETRPFVDINFDRTTEGTTVTLDSVELDNVEVASDFERRAGTNRFVYWPPSISQGKHEMEVEATDAAGNELTFDFSFTVEARGDFVIELQAGWNAISVPADPVDTAIGSVFTDPAIETVIGWDTQGWRIAVRRDGVWGSNDSIGQPLNEIKAKYGYWVKSSDFIDQPVALTANERGVGGLRVPLSIDTKAGWNFVGVIDQDGDQTEGDAFDTSLRSGETAVSAAEYLGSKYVRAYTWDSTFSNFEVLRPDVAMTIGDGVWVYYEGGIAP